MKMKKKGKLNTKKKIFTLLLAGVMMVGSSMTVFAEGETTTNHTCVMGKLSDKVKTNTSGDDDTYPAEGGGTVAGSDLWEDDKANDCWTVKEDEFNKLSSKGKDQFLGDIVSETESAVGKDNITNQTAENWWKQLQTKNGVGSKFMSVILQDAKPDFVSANAIFKPFSGPIGVFLGVLAVALMSFLGIVMISDICYITLPPVRLFVSENENDDKIARSKLFSHDAIYAVKKVEEGGDSGTPKQALGIYFKRRVFMLVLLGIALLYLVQGRIYTLVGYILDLLSGVL